MQNNNLAAGLANYLKDVVQDDVGNIPIRD